MSRGLCRVGQDLVAEGAVISGSTNVFINNLPAVILGSPVASHNYFHFFSTMTSTATRTFINGMPVVLAGDYATCGHPILPGSDNVFAESSAAPEPPPDFVTDELGRVITDDFGNQLLL
jgi:uncharacterized Zn-binding protein involved in type VI secretion